MSLILLVASAVSAYAQVPSYSCQPDGLVKWAYTALAPVEQRAEAFLSESPVVSVEIQMAYRDRIRTCDEQTFAPSRADKVRQVNVTEQHARGRLQELKDQQAAARIRCGDTAKTCLAEVNRLFSDTIDAVTRERDTQLGGFRRQLGSMKIDTYSSDKMLATLDLFDHAVKTVRAEIKPPYEFTGLQLKPRETSRDGRVILYVANLEYRDAHFDYVTQLWLNVESLPDQATKNEVTRLIRAKLKVSPDVIPTRDERPYRDQIAGGAERLPNAGGVVAEHGFAIGSQKRLRKEFRP